MGIWQQLIEFDKSVFLGINELNSIYFDNFMYLVSKVGIWIFLYASVLFLAIYNYRKKALLIILLLILCVVLTDQLSVFIKESFERLRPSHNPDFAEIIHLVKNKKGGMHGFVSSHAANVVGFTTLTSLFFRNRILSISLIIWSLIVCYSRIYLGMHYPADILGGVVTGIVIALAIYLLARKKTAEFLQNSTEFYWIPVFISALTFVGIGIYSFF